MGQTESRVAAAKSPVWYFMVLPSTVIFVVFGILPILATFVLSLTNWNLLDPPRFVGLANFARLMHDPLFGNALLRTVYYILMFVLPVAALSLGLALLVNLPVKGATFFRGAYFTPVVTSATIVAMIWGWLFLSTPEGPLNYLLGRLGIGPQPWILSTGQALPSIAIISIWSSVGYYMTLWLSGLQTIPQDVYDAAAVDGAVGWNRFRYVTLPMLQPITTFILIIATIGAFQAFNSSYLLTKGGPYHSTTTIVYWIYSAGFEMLDMGYATAGSVVLLVCILAVALVQRRFLGGTEGVHD